jgi:glycosyltransferase involved in cell wall biosynthesis
VVIAPFSQVFQLRALGWDLPYEVIPLPPRSLHLIRIAPMVGLAIMDVFLAFLQWRYKFDVWHVTMAYPLGVSVARYGQKSHVNIPYLIRCAGEDIQKDEVLGYGMRLDVKVDRLIRKWLPQANSLIATTESVAKEYHALGILDDRIIRIPNGVDLKRFKEAPRNKSDLRKALGIPDERFVFLSVGRHHPKKNFEQLIEATGILRSKNFKPFSLLIVGDGVEALAPVVARLGLQEVVYLHPAEAAYNNEGSGFQLPTDGLLNFYKMADAFVFPSLIETFGVVLVEAMAAGLPIITTDAAGCRDVVRGGRDALTVSAGDVSALAKAMDTFVTKPEETVRWSERSHRRVRDFDWDTIVRHYIRAYEKCIIESKN